MRVIEINSKVLALRDPSREFDNEFMERAELLDTKLNSDDEFMVAVATTQLDERKYVRCVDRLEDQPTPPRFA